MRTPLRAEPPRGTAVRFLQCDGCKRYVSMAEKECMDWIVIVRSVGEFGGTSETKEFCSEPCLKGHRAAESNPGTLPDNKLRRIHSHE